MENLLCCTKGNSPLLAKGKKKKALKILCNDRPVTHKIFTLYKEATENTQKTV